MSVTDTSLIRLVESRGDQVVRLLGRGSYGSVYLALHPALQMESALKVASLASSPNARQEAKMLSLLAHGHPSIVWLCGSWEVESHLVIRMHYVEGPTLLDHLQNSIFNEPEAKPLFSQLVSAMHYAHETCRIAHRDLKDENLILSKAGDRLTIIDWGMAIETAPDRYFKEDFGAPHYVPPELYLRVPYRGPEVDVWSLGVILFTMLTGALPFQGADITELAKAITSVSYARQAFSSFFSPAVGDLIQRIFDPNPATRITAGEILQHPWLRERLTAQPWREVDLHRFYLTTETDEHIRSNLGILQAAFPIAQDQRLKRSPWYTSLGETVLKHSSRPRPRSRRSSRQKATSDKSGDLLHTSSIWPSSERPHPILELDDIPRNLSSSDLPLPLKSKHRAGLSPEIDFKQPASSKSPLRRSIARRHKTNRA